MRRRMPTCCSPIRVPAESDSRGAARSVAATRPLDKQGMRGKEPRVPDLAIIALVTGAGFLGGAMNALAGGGSFATMPALLAIGLPANIANSTSNFAVLPGAAMSSWSFRHERTPLGGVDLRVLGWVTFVAGLVGSMLLVLTPATTFDVIVRMEVVASELR